MRQEQSGGFGSDPARPPGPGELQLAAAAERVPGGDGWLHELKYDGYRLLAAIERGRVRLWTRRGMDWTERYPAVVEGLRALNVDSAVLDGEVVAQRPDGNMSFQALQNGGEDCALLYYVFDVLEAGGRDVRGLTQEERKEVLRGVIGRVREGAVVRLSDHVVGQGAVFYERVCAAGLEGVISKRRGAPYLPGRSGNWLKVKCVRRQEFAVVGFSEPAGSRVGLGALVVATREGGGFVYRGRVGTGLDDDSLVSLRRLLDPLQRDTPPVSGADAAMSDILWVEPILVVEVEYAELTSDGVLRHPVFKGIRADKSPDETVLEGPARSRAGVASGAVGQPLSRQAGGRTARAQIQIAGVRLSNPDRVLYPEKGITKENLARYYEAVAGWMVPHIANRPLTLVRCPAGYTGDCFFQKHPEGISSPHVGRVAVTDAGGAREYATVRDVAGLVALVQLGTLELHSWNSRSDRPEQPDRVTMDIDPDPAVTWDGVVQAALEIRALLGELGLQCFAKTTGGKGLHVVVPLARRSGWEEVRAFSRVVAATVAAASPGRYTLELARARRTGRLLLDYYRNVRGATAVEVYSTRARSGAPVSTPVSWEELRHGIDPAEFTIETVPRRLASGIDPWRDYGAVRQSLTVPLLRRLGLR